MEELADEQIVFNRDPCCSYWHFRSVRFTRTRYDFFEIPIVDRGFHDRAELLSRASAIGVVIIGVVTSDYMSSSAAWLENQLWMTLNLANKEGIEVDDEDLLHLNDGRVLVRRKNW